MNILDFKDQLLKIINDADNTYYSSSENNLQLRNHYLKIRLEEIENDIIPYSSLLFDRELEEKYYKQFCSSMKSSIASLNEADRKENIIQAKKETMDPKINDFVDFECDGKTFSGVFVKEDASNISIALTKDEFVKVNQHLALQGVNIQFFPTFKTILTKENEMNGYEKKMANFIKNKNSLQILSQNKNYIKNITVKSNYKNNFDLKEKHNGEKYLMSFYDNRSNKTYYEEITIIKKANPIYQDYYFKFNNTVSDEFKKIFCFDYNTYSALYNILGSPSTDILGCYTQGAGDMHFISKIENTVSREIENKSILFINNSLYKFDEIISSQYNRYYLLPTDLKIAIRQEFSNFLEEDISKIKLFAITPNQINLPDDLTIKSIIEFYLVQKCFEKDKDNLLLKKAPVSILEKIYFASISNEDIENINNMFILKNNISIHPLYEYYSKVASFANLVYKDNYRLSELDVKDVISKIPTSLLDGKSVSLNENLSIQDKSILSQISYQLDRLIENSYISNKSIQDYKNSYPVIFQHFVENYKNNLTNLLSYQSNNKLLSTFEIMAETIYFEKYMHDNFKNNAFKLNDISIIKDTISNIVDDYNQKNKTIPIEKFSAIKEQYIKETLITIQHELERHRLIVIDPNHEKFLFKTWLYATQYGAFNLKTSKLTKNDILDAFNLGSFQSQDIISIDAFDKMFLEMTKEIKKNKEELVEQPNILLNDIPTMDFLKKLKTGDIVKFKLKTHNHRFYHYIVEKNNEDSDIIWFKSTLNSSMSLNKKTLDFYNKTAGGGFNLDLCFVDTELQTLQQVIDNKSFVLDDGDINPEFLKLIPPPQLEKKPSSEISQALYRTATDQGVAALRNILLKTAKNSEKENLLEEVLKSDIGEAILRSSLGYTSTLAFENKNKHLDIISKELRVSGLACAGNFIFDLAANHLKPILFSMLNNENNQEVRIEKISEIEEIPPIETEKVKDISQLN